MDKSFNDDELADIMSEIENLEKEFAESASAPTEESVEPEAVHEEHDHTEPEVLSKLVEKPIEESVLKTNHVEKVVAMKKVDAPAPSNHHSSGHSSLSFKVEGEMTLSLSFEVNGQSVSLDISDSGLEIQMESGASFHLPMKQSGAGKKAA